MDEFVSIVSTVGFPIAAYAAMFYYMVKKDESHKEEVSALKDSLNLNTQAITELRDVITYMKGEK